MPPATARRTPRPPYRSCLDNPAPSPAPVHAKRPPARGNTPFRAAAIHSDGLWRKSAAPTAARTPANRFPNKNCSKARRAKSIKTAPPQSGKRRTAARQTPMSRPCWSGKNHYAWPPSRIRFTYSRQETKYSELSTTAPAAHHRPAGVWSNKRITASAKYSRIIMHDH